MYKHIFREPVNGKSPVVLPPDGDYLLLLCIDERQYIPEIVTIRQRHMETVYFHIDCFTPSLTSDYLERGKEWSFAEVEFIPTKSKDAHTAIKELYKRSKEMEEKVSVLQELVDRPDAAGCKFSYEQICNVLS